jgi:hypothetical protein
MKIRLRVNTSPTESFEWEHAGPRMQIGKENCQLGFPDEQSVSRRHAEIELSARGAVLYDTGSTNGTYLNGAPLSGPARLSVGDQVTLGLGGPRLDVLSLDLVATTERVAAWSKPVSNPRSSSPPPERVPAPVSQPASSAAPGFGIIALTAVVTVAIVCGIVWSRGNKDDSSVSDAPKPDAETPNTQTPAPAVTAAEKREASPPAKVEPLAPGDETQSAASPTTNTSKQSPRAPEPSPVPAAPPPFAGSIEEAVKPRKPAIVWIGYKLEDNIFSYASGWALQPGVVVTTAETARQLKVIVNKASTGEFGPATLVVHDADRSIRIRELQMHPAYDAEQPATPVSVGHNFAVAFLDGKLEAVCPLATEADIAGMNTQTPLLALGYVDESTTREPYDKIKLLVRPQRLPIRVTASDPPGSDRPLSYQLNVGEMETATGPLENMAGSPVFNDHGRVVGVLAVVGTSFRLSSIDSVRDWLEGMGH